jgi:hypothetical protein
MLARLHGDAAEGLGGDLIESALTCVPRMARFNIRSTAVQFAVFHQREIGWIRVRSRAHSTSIAKT